MKKQWPAMLALLFVCTLGFAANSQAKRNPPPQPPPPEALSKVISSLVSGNRDSMMLEIKRYTKEISALRDSLAMAGGDVEIDDEQRIRFQESIGEISGVISDISEELSHLEFQISDNMISLLDESGEGITINIPDNLDEQVKEGIEALTQVVLAQLPDTMNVDPHLDWNWFGGQPEAPKHPRRISHGNVVKVWDDLFIAGDEDIRGNVVCVAGDVRIEGRVDGNVTVVMGDLELAGDAEILGDVVMVMGRVTEEDSSILNEITIIEPLGPSGLSLDALEDNGGLVFLISQGLFILVVMVILLGMSVLPESRVSNVRLAILGAPWPSLGIGFIVAMLGHLFVLLLVAMLVLTVIGIPLALLFGLGMGLLWIICTGAASMVLGEKLLSLVGIDCSSRWICVLTGLVALHMVSFLGSLLGAILGLNVFSSFLIALGAVIKGMGYLFGLGALLLSRFGSKVQ